MLGHRFPSAVLGRVHAVDHPVLALRLEQHVLALHAVAVEGDDHLVVAELVAVVGAFVPDPHAAGAVVSGGDLAREVDVAQRVVLDVHRETVALRVVRDALRDRPGDEHAIAFEPQVPMQAARVVLLHYEAGAPPGTTILARRLGGAGEVPFGVVLAERALLGG